MGKITESDKNLVKETMQAVCYKIMGLIEGDFCNDFEIELLVDGKKYLMTIKEVKP